MVDFEKVRKFIIGRFESFHEDSKFTILICLLSTHSHKQKMQMKSKIYFFSKNILTESNAIKANNKSIGLGTSGAVLDACSVAL